MRRNQAWFRNALILLGTIIVLLVIAVFIARGLTG